MRLLVPLVKIVACQRRFSSVPWERVTRDTLMVARAFVTVIIIVVKNEFAAIAIRMNWREVTVAAVARRKCYWTIVRKTH